MKTLLDRLLVFAGACMIAGSVLASVDWAICANRKRQEGACDPNMTRAVAAWAAAASWASGVAIKIDQQP